MVKRFSSEQSFAPDQYKKYSPSREKGSSDGNPLRVVSLTMFNWIAGNFERKKRPSLLLGAHAKLKQKVIEEEPFRNYLLALKFD